MIDYIFTGGTVITMDQRRVSFLAARWQWTATLSADHRICLVCLTDINHFAGKSLR